MKSFYDKENACVFNFSQAGDCWHMWTQDSFPIIFTEVADYHAVMFIIGLAATLVPGIRIFTFAVMNNHFHFAIAGSESCCREFFQLVLLYLGRYLKAKNSTVRLRDLECKMRKLNNVKEMRTVITYINRNGYLVHPEHSPYSFPWGANGYYYMPFARKYYETNRQKIQIRTRREITRSHDADHIEGILSLDGCACPLSYCDISCGEMMFRDAAHYFQELSRNIEGQKAIAKEIGESIFYTDDELFRVISNACREKYGQPSPALISSDAKIEMAKYMHFEYNSSNKQICRILKISDNVINSLFRQ